MPRWSGWRRRSTMCRCSRSTWRWTRGAGARPCSRARRAGGGAYPSTSNGAKTPTAAGSPTSPHPDRPSTTAATPELLEHYGVDPGAVDPRINVFTARRSQLVFDRPGDRSPPEVAAHVERLDLPGYTEAPTTLITHEAVRRRGWETGRVGWLVESARPLTGAERSAVRDIAADAGLTVETREDERQLSTVRSGATVAGGCWRAASSP